MATIEELELFCKQAYESENSEIRSRAEQACLSVSESPNGLETSRVLLERGDSPYSQLVAISTLSKLLSKSDGTGVIGNVAVPGVIDLSTIEQRLEIRNMCLNYLIQKETLADFVMRALIALICRITKFGWLDTSPSVTDQQQQHDPQGMGRDECCYVFREIVDPLTNMIKSAQPRPMLIAVQVLHSMVLEFNQSYDGDITRASIAMRKISNNFREHQLFAIFGTSIELLDRMASNIKSLNLYDNLQHSIVQYSLKLTLACLSYDFIGTYGGEEVSDDMMSVQVPTNWRQAFLSPSDTTDPVPLFFRLYEKLPASLGHLALSCLVQTASFRRSFFNNNERQVFLGQLVEGVCEILARTGQPSNGMLLTSGGGRNVGISGGTGGVGNGPMSDDDERSCFHELCRLVCRLKSNFQLGELVALPSYSRFIELLATVTVRALLDHEASGGATANSQHYLLMTWQRLVASLPYLRASQPHLLDAHCPAVLDAYVRSRLRLAAAAGSAGCGGGGPWGDLEDAVGVPQELEAVAVLSRCQYALSVTRLVALFDESVARFSSCVSAAGLGGSAVPLGTNRTGQLTEAATRMHELCWLVLLMGACVGGRIGCSASTGASCSSSTGGGGSPGGSGSADDNDRLDGELVARVLQLAAGVVVDMPAELCATRDDPGTAATSGRRSGSGGISTATGAVQALAGLEMAVLAFLDQIRRVYLCGESCLRAQRLYDVLQLRVAIADDNALLDTVVQKILLNLRCWAGISSPVIARSLALFHELSLGAVAKRLMKLPVVLGLLENHSPLQLPFLLHSGREPALIAFGTGGSPGGGLSASNDLYRHNAVQLSTNITGASSNARTCFYASLTRLFLLSPHAEETPVFLAFMAPLTRACDALTQSLMSSATNSMDARMENKLALLALIRDVRGVATACHSKGSFQALFDWLYPAMLSHLLVAIDLWGPTEQDGLALGCLKLAGELSLSRNNRLQPQVASPSGELMFRVCSRVLICYGDKISQERLDAVRAGHKSRYLLYIKETTACIDILRNLLTGNYVNLGAFALYADDSLEKCLHIFLQLVVSIPPEDMMAYPKLARSYYCLADSLTQDHLIWLGTQQPEMILYFISTICDGITSTSLAVSSSCCSSLDNVASFLLRLVQSQLVVAGGGAPRPAHPSPSRDMVRLSDNVQASIEHFLLTSQHLGRRESESRATYCQLLMEPGSGRLGALLSRSMDRLFQALMQPDCKNQWAMSRPLLGLILLNTKAFEELQQCYASSSATSADSMKSAFEKLMEDVNCSLSIRNRDKFTQNLNTFRHNLNGSSKLSIDYHSSNSIEMVA